MLGSMLTPDKTPIKTVAQLAAELKQDGIAVGNPFYYIQNADGSGFYAYSFDLVQPVGKAAAS
jgi:hypothetical protein